MMKLFLKNIPTILVGFFLGLLFFWWLSFGLDTLSRIDSITLFIEKQPEVSTCQE